MIIRYSPRLVDKLKKSNVRIRKSFKERIKIFEKNPLEPKLNNHELRDKYEGFKSIDITNDYRAIFSEVNEADEEVVYFIQLGTHQELYG